MNRRLLFFSLALLSVPCFAFAQESKISSNVFRIGSNVVINTEVDGDVYAVGQLITIRGRVSGDVMAVGQKIVVDGTIDGDLRAIGQQIIINGVVNHNAAFLADSFTVSDTGGVSQSVTGIATYGTLVGPIGRDIEGIYSSVFVAGPVGRDIRVRVHNDFNSGLQILSTARVGGTVDYYAYRQATPARRAMITGPMTFHQLESKQTEESSTVSLAWWIWLVIRMIGLIIITWIFWQLGTKKFDRVLEMMQQQTASSLWWGLLLLILSPVIIVAIALTLIGLPLALLLTLIYAAGLIFFIPWAAVLLGQQIVMFLGHARRANRLVVIILGVLLFLFLTNLPYIGNLLYILLLILTWGAIWRSLSIKR